MTHAHEAVKTRHKESSLVFPVLALAVLTCVIGVVLVFRPDTGVRALTALMGLSLLCDGVLNLSVALCTVKIVNHQRPDVIETDDYEIGKDE